MMMVVGFVARVDSCLMISRRLMVEKDDSMNEDSIPIPTVHRMIESNHFQVVPLQFNDFFHRLPTYLPMVHLVVFGDVRT